MKTSEAFIATKPWILDGVENNHLKSTYVCIAACDVSIVCAAKVRAVVLPLLDSWSTLENWLEAEHGIRPSSRAIYIEKMQATRHAWVDHLIAHYQSIGD